MSASRLRLENISLFNYLKYEVISPAFSEQISSESLVYDASKGAYVTNSTVIPSPTSAGRGWVFFDDTTVNGNTVAITTQEQGAKVTVIGASTYTVNYKDGQIINPDTTPTSVSYYWNYVSVLPSWPGTNPPPLPFVAVGTDGRRKKGFQLGGGVHNLSKVYFHVFATSPAERDDISDVIHGAIFNHSIGINDFSNGGYLNYDGTYNTDLSLPLSTLGNILFVDTEHKNIYSPDDFSGLNKYRSIVTGTYECFVD